MTEVSQQAAQYLEDVFAATGLQLRVDVRQSVSGEVLDIEGKDAELLQAQTGELLEALQHLINQVFGRSLVGSARLVCDVNGFAQHAKPNYRRWQIWRRIACGKRARPLLLSR
jgi:predicted RNA-binding protein Jag